jgi:hypothetical protein
MKVLDDMFSSGRRAFVEASTVTPSSTSSTVAALLLGT